MGTIQTHCGHIGGRSYDQAMWTHRWQSVSFFSYDYSLQLTENEGRFIRHPYGTAHQDAECGHIGGRAYGRAMWTHRWQSVSYYLLRSTAAWPPKCPPRGPHAGPKMPPRRCRSDPSRVPSIPHPPRSRTTPLHTASDVEKMPRHPRPEPSERIKTARKGHPPRPPEWRRENETRATLSDLGTDKRLCDRN